MPEMLRLGPINLHTELLAILIGFALGTWLIRIRFRPQAPMGNIIADILLNGGLIVILFWKFGVALTSPSLIVHDPMKLMFLTGSTLELLIGIAAALIYAYWQLHKKRIPLYSALDIAVTGMVTGLIVYYALVFEFGQPTLLPWGIGVEGTETRFHPVNGYLAILLIPLWARLLVLRREPGTGWMLKETLVYFGLAAMAVSLLDDAAPSIIYISYAQIIYLAIIIIGMLLPKISNPERES